MALNVNMPEWLDFIIYDKYEAVYEPRPQDVVYNPDQPYDFVKLYLGTYFPRSYAEAYSILLKLFQNIKYKDAIQQVEEINILDFCCGTGGELVGMIIALQLLHPNLKRINIDAVDANPDAIRVLYHLAEDLKGVDDIKIEFYIQPMCLFVETEQDFEDFIHMLNRKYHYILSFKALNEFIQNKSFWKENIYSKVSGYFLPLLLSNGALILSDVTTKLDDIYLFYPQLMNKGINEALRRNRAYKSIVPHSCYYMEDKCEGCYMQDVFTITHSRKQMDRTKVAYRVICHADFANSIMDGIRHNNCRAVNRLADKFEPYR